LFVVDSARFADLLTELTLAFGEVEANEYDIWSCQ